MAAAAKGRNLQRAPAAAIRSTEKLCLLLNGRFTVLFWAVPSLIRPGAEIERSSLVAVGDSKCIPRSMHEQVAEQHPSRLSKKSNTEAAVHRRRSLRTHCSDPGFRNDSAGASEMALDTCNCRTE